MGTFQGSFCHGEPGVVSVRMININFHTLSEKHFARLQEVKSWLKEGLEDFEEPLPLGFSMAIWEDVVLDSRVSDNIQDTFHGRACRSKAVGDCTLEIFYFWQKLCLCVQQAHPSVVESDEKEMSLS